MTGKTFITRLTNETIGDYDAQIDYALISFSEADLEELERLASFHTILKNSLPILAEGLHDSGSEISFYNDLPMFLAHDFGLVPLNDSVIYMEEKLLPYVEIDEPDVELKPKPTEFCEVHVIEEGIYWTTYEKNGDVRFSTKVIPWKALGIEKS